MRPKLSVLVSLALMAALGVAIGVGLAILYAGHLYSPYEDLTQLQVLDPAYSAANSGPLGEPIDSAVAARTRADVERWAAENRATVLRSNAFGYDVCACSDLLERVLGTGGAGVPGAGTPVTVGLAAGAPAGVYLRDDPTLMGPYVRGGRFLPGSANLPALGTFDPPAATAFLAATDALSSFAAGMPSAYGADAAEGIYLTDAAETDGLVEIFEAGGYEVYVISQPFGTALAQLPAALLADESVSRVTLYALVALLFSLGFVTLGAFRSIARRVRIHHLFGLSCRRVALTVAGAGAAVLATQTVLLAVLLPASFFYFGEKDLARLLVVTLALSAALLVAAGVAGCRWLFRRLGPERGRP